MNCNRCPLSYWAGMWLYCEKLSRKISGVWGTASEGELESMNIRSPQDCPIYKAKESTTNQENT